MDRFVQQEVHCTLSGGGCGGFILVKLNVSLDGVVDVVCPKCGHKHRRCIEKGHVLESGRYRGSGSLEDICPTMGAWSNLPRTKAMDGIAEIVREKGTAVIPGERDGVLITTETEMVREPQTVQAVLLDQESQENQLQLRMREAWVEFQGEH